MHSYAGASANTTNNTEKRKLHNLARRLARKWKLGLNLAYQMRGREICFSRG